MREHLDFVGRFFLLALIWLVWWWAFEAPLSSTLDILIMVGGVLLVFPLIWLARTRLDRRPTQQRAVAMTTFVHLALGVLLGVPMIRAAYFPAPSAAWVLPVPTGIGLSLFILTGIAFFLVVVNLALKGSGAPMFIALSQRLAVDWLYAWTRNPMVLAGVAFFLALGLWLQSWTFVLWVLLLFTPALLFFIKVFEERELEVRFGEAYREYRKRTPMLWPGKPKG
jgi:protein-S-isoprenylcysteine O-methyltransferase Ste14